MREDNDRCGCAGGLNAAMEIAFNLRNLQLVLQAAGGRLVFERGGEFLELPEPK